MKMKLLFKNTTKFSKQLYSNFLSFHNKKYNFSYYFYTSIVSILLIFCISAQFISHNYFLTFIYICILTCFLIWRFFHPIGIVKKEYHSEKVENQKKITYLFYPHFFEVRYNNEKTFVLYLKIRKIFETQDYFYLYLNKTHAYIIDKHNFSVGTLEDFSKFMKKKYRIRYKKEV